MPTNIATNSDNIPLALPNGTPITGTPAIYFADSLAGGDTWPVIPVSAPGNPNPAASIGDAVSFDFLADNPSWGIIMSLTRMAMLGWTEVDQIGVELAAYTNGTGFLPVPKIDDQLITADGRLRSVTAVGPISRQAVNLKYELRAA
jgi:hypothetical protein